MSRTSDPKPPYEGAVPLRGRAHQEDEVNSVWVSRDTVPLRQGPERAELEERAARLGLILGRRPRSRRSGSAAREEISRSFGNTP
jgi:hypothetical protein